MDSERVMTKQQAYAKYADAMQAGNIYARCDDDAEAGKYYNEAELWWDIYFYWDDVEE